MRQLVFTPALRLLGRLRFAHKFALIGLVLVVAVAVVGRAYLQVQHTQIAFSAKERVGIKVIEPAGQLLGDLASARAAAVRGEGSTDERIAAVHESAARVAAAVKADNGALGLDKEWSTLSEAIDATLGNLPTGVGERSKALGELTNGAALLIVNAGNNSNLILDPDLDSFYVMDALVTKAPGMLTGLADASDRAVLAEVDRAHALDHRIDLALTQGAIMSASEANTAGLKTSYASTADDRLEDDLSAPVSAAAAATEKASEGLTALVRDGNADAVDPTAIDRAIEQTTAAHRVLGPALDRLIEARINGFTGARRNVVVLATVLILLAVYLFVGLLLAIREGTGRMRRRLASLGEHEAADLRDGLAAIAAGNLTREIAATTAPIERGSHDEIGDLEEAVEGIRADTATSIDRYNEMREQTASMLRDIAAGSEVVAAASERVVVTTEQTSSAVTEIAQAAGNVAHGAEQQVRSVESVRTATEEVIAATRDGAAAARDTAETASRAGAVTQGAWPPRSRRRRRWRRCASSPARSPRSWSSSPRCPSASAGSPTRSPASPTRRTCSRSTPRSRRRGQGSTAAGSPSSPSRSASSPRSRSRRRARSPRSSTRSARRPCTPPSSPPPARAAARRATPSSSAPRSRSS